MAHWINDGTNKEYIQRLRSLLSENDIAVFIFLGAGLSFGVDRGRVVFERFEYDDNSRFPSWPQLIHRMKKILLSNPVLQPFEDSVKRFFEKESALDCAELFRHYTQGPNYWDFLQGQFGTKQDDIHRLTPSHYALTLWWSQKSRQFLVENKTKHSHSRLLIVSVRIDLRLCLIVQRLMKPLVIVKREVGSQVAHRVCHALVIFDIHLLVFDTAP